MSMKHALLTTTFTLLLSTTVLIINSQVCVPTSAVPYSSEMPGITNFSCNTINRTSLSIEDPGNSYIMTSDTTTLVKGVTYPVSVTHTRDASFFPTAKNNIRIWIDYNNDNVLDTVTELSMGLYGQTFGTSNGNITIPLSASTATVRMRVTAKMSSDAGHSYPSPCDNPADPIGYHGEIEDYTVNIIPNNSLDDFPSGLTNFTIYPNPVSEDFTINYSLMVTSDVFINIYDVCGKKISVTTPKEHTSGSYALNLNTYGLGLEKSGIYFAELTVNNHKVIRRFVVK